MKYLCGKCGKNYIKSDKPVTTACLVMHFPGSCCHYNEKEITN